MGDKERLVELIAQMEGTAGNDISRATSPGGLAANQEDQESRKATRSRPRTYPYFRYLPYEVEPEEERQANLEEIISNLYVTLKAGDFSPGAVHWTRELRSWLGLKFDLTKEQRVKLVKLYYELSLAPGIDFPVLERFASMFMVLTKRKHYLRPMVDLTLDWRPLYREIKHFVLPSETGLLQASYGKRNYRTLTKLSTFAQLYFDPQEMPAMLEEFLPYFDLSFPEEAFVVIGLVNLFLPTVPASPPDEKLVPQYHLPTLFHLWSMINRARSIDQHFLDFFSRIARDSLTSHHVPWSAHGVFTREQSALIFTAILRLLEVPVAQATSPYTNVDTSAGLGIMLERDTRKHPIAHQIARWIVMSLSSECLNDSDSILVSLEGLIQAVETFFHPSNVGSWSKMLSQLVYYLADFFLMRWNREKSGEMDVPEERRLNDKLKRRFVLCLRDAVFMGIYSKSGTAMNFSLSTLQSLAYLEPELILQPALQRIYPSMQGLVEVHRTTSSLRALQTLTRIMVETKGFRCHATTMLGLALPGIDANDLDKTLYSLAFMQSVFFNIPIYDLSRGEGNTVAMDWITSEMSRLEGAGADLEISYDKEIENEEEVILRSSTASFAEFLSSFLGRVFTLLENLPDAARVRSGSPEENVVNTLPAVFTPLLAALSPELYDLALNKIADFVSNHVIHQARDAMAFICNSLCKIAPEKALKRLIPLLIAAIKTEIVENGAASTRNAGSEVLPRDRGLVWNVSMLGMCVVHTGEAVLTFKSELMDIAMYMHKKCQGTPAVHISNFIHHLLLNLTSIYTIDFAQYEAREYERGLSASDWGDFPKPDKLEVQWHVPSAEEVEFAVKLFSDLASSAVKSLESLIAGTSSVKRDGSGKAWSDEGSRNLVLIRLLLAGISNLFDGKANSSQDDGDVDDPSTEGPPLANGKPPEEKDENSQEDLASYGENEVRKTFKYPDGYALSPSDQKYAEIHELRVQIGALLHQVHEFLVANQQDDLTCFTPLYTAFKSWFIDFGIEKSAHVLDRVTRLYAADIHPFKVSGLRKVYPRALLLKRANVYHLQRLRYNASPRKATDMDKQLLLDLAQSSVSSYTEVRRNAQSAIESASKVIMGARSVLIPPIVQAYEEGIASSDFAKVKGGVYSVLLGSMAKTVGRDWRYAPQVIKLYLATCDVDKPSIQKVITTATVQIMDFCRAPERMAILDQEIVQSIASSDDHTSYEIDKKQSKVKKHRAAVERRKVRLMEDLVKMTRDAHWKTASRTVAILVTLGFRFETIAPESLVDLVLKGSIDTHPSLRGLYSSALMALFNLIVVRVLCEHKYENYILEKHTMIGRVDISTRQDDPNWTQEHLESFARSDTAYYIDHQYPGWLVWRDKMPAYMSDRKEPVPYDSLELDVVNRIGKALRRDWFSTFFNYLLQEPRDSSADRFRVTGAMILGHAFALLHDGFTAATFDDIKQEITNTFGDGSDKHKHRATAEILAGLLNSISNKSIGIRAEVWEFCMTFVLRVFEDGLTPENSSYWTTMLHMMFAGKDPRRSWPLMEWLADFRLDMSSNAAFKESSKIVLLTQCINNAGWHFQLEKPILEDFLAHLDHPYKGVREAMGTTLAAIYRTRYHESYKDVPTLINDQREISSIGSAPYKPTPEFSKNMHTIFEKLEKWRKERTPGQQTPSSYTSGGKTVLLWLDATLSSWECTQLAPFFPSLFVEQLLHMMDIKEDQELQSLAYVVFRQICNIPLRQGEDAELIATLVRIGTTSPLWHQRLRILINIQGLYFRRLFLMTREQQRSLFDCAANMLSDAQHEVRQGAMTTLSGLIRCSPRALRDDMVKRLSEQFTKMLIDNPRPKKPKPVVGLRPGSAADSAPSTGTSTPTPEHAKLVRMRHAAVLGLGALVQAFPYQSPPPEWIPEVLATLANKANADPGVVGKSVKSILSDFKKTRQDTWHMDLKVSKPLTATIYMRSYRRAMLTSSYRRSLRSKRRISRAFCGRATLRECFDTLLHTFLFGRGLA